MDTLREEIQSGKYKVGNRFPSEAALVQRFGTSRITVGRALRELSQQGLVSRIAGSGTYIREGAATGGLLFGLLIPDLGRTEIFEPICQGIAGAPEPGRHALLWAHMDAPASDLEQQALELCERYLKQNVSGVFFAPVEGTSDAFNTNRTIAARLREARIPIVLLDRCFMPYPGRSVHDLVGIDNRRAGYQATGHLLTAGARRVSFLAIDRSASTVDARIAGYRDALLAHGAKLENMQVYRLEEISSASVKPLLAASGKGDGVVCANDRTAGEFLHAAMNQGYRVPQDVRVVGIDDLEYARLLPVPLTTIHQPCREIGEAAMGVMLERIRRPNMTTRDVLLESRLVVRQSCGARATS